MKLDKNLPSHMVIAGDSVIVSYDGQPVSCYACGGAGHMRQTCPYRRSEEQASPPTPDNSWAKVAATGKPTHKNRVEGNGETNSQTAEGAQTQFQPGKYLAPFNRTNLTTVERDPGLQREGGAGRQEEEDDTLDWAALVTAHAEDRTEDMDLSTENLSEVEEAGRPGMTQGKLTSR